MWNSNKNANRFVILSVALHTSLAVGLTQMDPDIFSPLPEGTIASVEFTTVEPNYGQQVETTDVGEVEDSEPVIEQAPEPIVEATPEPVPEPETVVAEELPPPVEKKMTAVEPAVETPDVKEVETVTVEESPVAVNTPEDESEAVAENEVHKQDMKPIVEDEEFEQLEEQEVAEGFATEEEPAKEVDEQSERTDVVAAATSEKATATKISEQTTSDKNTDPTTSGETYQSNMNYGVPTGVRDVKDLRQAPGNVPPQYPQASRLRRETGNVKLLYYVTSDGRVTNLKLLRSSGHQNLDKEAVSAISRYRFFPGQQGYTSHIVNFNLKGPAQPAGGRLRFRSTN